MHTIALDSGLRPAELFGLEWQDVDMEGSFLSVRRSVEEIEGKL